MIAKSPRLRRPSRLSQSAPVATPPAAEAESLLRDLAFVLHLTREVEGQMMAERESDHSSLALALGACR